MSDTSGIHDEVTAEIKGPDPKVWGKKHAAKPGPQKLPKGVKGPDPEVWGEEHAAPAE